MAVHPLALKSGLNRAQIRHVVDNAEATMAIGNGPTMILILGRDIDGSLIEASCVIRKEDVLVVHAQLSRPEYLPLLELALTLPGGGIDSGLEDEEEAQWGRSVDGLSITNELAAELFQRAELGHDYDVLRVRLRRGRPAPLAVGEPIRLVLEPSLFSAASELADKWGVAIADVARTAIDRRLGLFEPA